MKLSLKQALWVPPVVMALVLAVMSTAALLRTKTLVAETSAALLSQQHKLETSAQWSALTQVNAARALALVAAQDPELEAVLKTDIAATSEKISTLQKRLDADVTDPEERVALSQVGERRKAYLAARDSARDAKVADPQAAMQLMKERVKPALEIYLKSQSDFVAQQARSNEVLLAKAGQQRMNTLYGVVGLIALVVLGMTVGTVFLVRHICGPLMVLCRQAERIGQGDLTQALHTDRNDEIGQLQAAVGQMQDALSRTVTQVRESAESIQVASSEVASGTQDLSGRTEQTASNLQQTASSMEQLTGTVKQTADSARTANQLAGSAAEAAQRGGSVVSQVVSNMEEINTSSRKIADIIGTIDGIAFQTNILALNAAVEAARAGEQGRGFAVVAGEVRNLAQRSANAAREIKSLIGASVERVESGTRLVNDAGSTMAEIVSSVQRVSDIIGEITAAATEQSGELGQVAGAVTQLDQMTQQNAALVEQSNAAAESLKDQATRLAEVVRVFNIGGAAMGRAPVTRSTPRITPRVAVPPPATTRHRAPVALATTATSPSSSRPMPAQEASTASTSDSDWETF
jgi:methyl-accepting chemotaxis protein